MIGWTATGIPIPPLERQHPYVRPPARPPPACLCLAAGRRWVRRWATAGRAWCAAGRDEPGRDGGKPGASAPPSSSSKWCEPQT